MATKGLCAYCQKEYTRGGMVRHLQACPARQEVLEASTASKRKKEQLYHLLVQDAWEGIYWLHLEMNGRATLEDLDHYLRTIWLECCGHLSGFRVGEAFYTQLFDDGFSMGDEKSMNIAVQRVFKPGMVIPYEYDFGSTTDLHVRVMDRHEGKPTTRHPIALMGRNNPFVFPCGYCGEPAAWIDIFADYGDPKALVCEEHKENKDEEYLLPVVNSPRVGECAYSGPARPPY